MNQTFAHLLRIIQFGTIKVVPGLFNIVIIPFLLRLLGVGGYGVYSLLLGYALLTTTVLGALVTQPMYRFLSSNPDQLEKFNTFALFAGGLGAAVSFLTILLQSGNATYAAGFAVISFAAILSSVVSVRFQIETRITRLALFEALRVATFLALVAGQPILVSQFSIGHVIFALGLSYMVPLAMLAPKPTFTQPERVWLSSILRFGIKSATWLLLAGIPYVASKTLLAGKIPDAELGAFSATADFFYRGFGIINAAIVMWAFPVLSQAYDSGNIPKVRKVLGFVVAAYGATGGVILFFGSIAANALPKVTVFFSAGSLSFVMIMLSCFFWQGMSIAHKPFELALKTTQMIMAMLISLLLYAVGTAILYNVLAVDPVLAVSVALTVASVAYISRALTVKLKV